MFGRKKDIIVKKEIIPPHQIDPMKRRASFKQTRFDKYDMPGERQKAVRKVLFFILFIIFILFAIESCKSWNFYQ